jgi:3-isopropylmalate/(R)-2-methylmalate dehydratase large subunit
MSDEVRIDAAYGGSCTGGKMADMDMYAEVLQNALAQGKRVAEGVHLYIQFGSQKIKQYARERGYIEIFERAGAELIDPSCGACINAGPGASPSAETVTVSAQIETSRRSGLEVVLSFTVCLLRQHRGKIVAEEFLNQG